LGTVVQKKEFNVWQHILGHKHNWLSLLDGFCHLIALIYYVRAWVLLDGAAHQVEGVAEDRQGHLMMGQETYRTKKRKTDKQGEQVMWVNAIKGEISSGKQTTSYKHIRHLVGKMISNNVHECKSSFVLDRVVLKMLPHDLQHDGQPFGRNDGVLTISISAKEMKHLTCAKTDSNKQMTAA
jgi:hypothetical protein